MHAAMGRRPRPVIDVLGVTRREKNAETVDRGVDGDIGVPVVTGVGRMAYMDLHGRHSRGRHRFVRYSADGVAAV